MSDKIQREGIKLPKTEKGWNKVPEMELVDLIHLELGKLGKSRVTLADFEEYQPGHMLYDLRSPRVEVDHYLEEHPKLDSIRDDLSFAQGREVVIGGYNALFDRFQVHYLEIDGKVFLN